MKIFTIGFTQKSAETFFGLLRQPGLKRLVDIRLNNVSQLAGFAKKNDLKYFVETINRIDYVHQPKMAPSVELLQRYKTNGGDWATYERQFLELIAERDIEHQIPRALMEGACLLCSEASPAKCHRRLVAEYLQMKWDDIQIEHLK